LVIQVFTQALQTEFYNIDLPAMPHMEVNEFRQSFSSIVYTVYVPLNQTVTKITSHFSWNETNLI